MSVCTPSAEAVNGVGANSTVAGFMPTSKNVHVWSVTSMSFAASCRATSDVWTHMELGLCDDGFK
eukprot:2530487-Alexandrium_andersonii.AAC.1